MQRHIDRQEELAEAVHYQWARWMQYLFSKGTLNTDGTCTIPEWAVLRWHRQMTADYSDLSEYEKNSDRAEAKKLLDVIA